MKLFQSLFEIFPLLIRFDNKTRESVEVGKLRIMS